jgi:hypothetical protein
VKEQRLQDVDRRTERGDRRAVLDLAVPAAIRKLLAEEPLDERRHVDAEVRAARHDVAVDARLDLALEEAVIVPGGLNRRTALPDDAVPDEPDGPVCLVAPGIEPEQAQHLERVKGVGVIERPRPAAPPAVGRLEGQQASTPALVGDAGALRGDGLGRLVGQVAQHLPADRRVGIEQPVDDRHGLAVLRIGPFLVGCVDRRERS